MRGCSPVLIEKGKRRRKEIAALIMAGIPPKKIAGLMNCSLTHVYGAWRMWFTVNFPGEIEGRTHGGQREIAIQRSAELAKKKGIPAPFLDHPVLSEDTALDRIA